MKRIVFLSLLAISSCATTMQSDGELMTTAHIAAHGTRTFDAPPSKVFAAAIQALQADNYEVALQNVDKGLIVTRRKRIRTETDTSAYETSTGYAASSRAVTYYRQFTITITANGPNGSVLVATPSLFANDNDISDKPLWVLGTRDGEYALWTRLFDHVSQAL